MRHGATLALVPLWFGIALSPAPALAGGWSLPDESQGVRVAPLLLLSRPDVRADLKLNADQAADAGRVIDDLHRKAAALKGRTGAAAVAERKAVDELQKAWLESKLTEDQVDRLAQLDLRWEGVAALATRPAVAESLALSDEQKSALGRAIADHRAKARDTAAAEAQLNTRALTILSDAQKQQWERMLGRSFTPAKTSTPSPQPAGR